MLRLDDLQKHANEKGFEPQIRAATRDYLGQMDDKIRRAEHRLGLNHTINVLPPAWHISGVDAVTARRLCVSAILRSLNERGFQAYITQTARHEDAIAVFWALELSPAVDAEVESTLRQYSMAPDAVQKRIDDALGGGGAGHGAAESGAALKRRSGHRGHGH